MRMEVKMGKFQENEEKDLRENGREVLEGASDGRKDGA